MKKNQFSLSLGLVVVALLSISCSEQEITTVNNQGSQEINNLISITASSIVETFESGTKTDYAISNVALASGSWTFNDALIGTSTSDIKAGTKSVRIRNTGKITMLFDKQNGAGTVEIKHAKFGTDANSTWELYYSTNGGSTYSKVGNTITTSTTTLTTATFTVNAAGNVRFEIRKMSGGTARINIDDFSVSDYSTIVQPGPTNSEHLTLGNPSNASTNILYSENYLMIKPEYTLSYSNSKHIPNWVSWRVGPEWLGSTPRQDDFRADTTLPSGWYVSGSTEYSGSGFDRGHMCPSADRTSSVISNSATFLMTNMIPQAPNNNQITWANLENYTRTLVNAGNEVYVISGGYGQGGAGTNGYKTVIGNGTWVPAKTWKVLIVVPQGTNDLSRITTATRVIAVLMPNDQTCNSQPWGNYRVSVDQIEALTGYDFMSNVATSIQATLEAALDKGPTS